MELTLKQQKGLKIALDNYKENKKYVVISGYAGTGKSTLVRFIIEALGIPEEEICYCAFTGKAAEVLRKKGNPNSLTLHKLLYENYPRKDGTFYRRPKLSLEYKVVVVDEISMAPKEMVDLLLKFPVFCIFLGDPFQLPPICKDTDNGLLEHPDVFLDEIMRQAAESEIIQLTMKIRNHQPISYFKGKEVMVIPKSELLTGHLTWADMIICGTNNQRLTTNKEMRKILGYEKDIEEGEKVIVKRNYWDCLNFDFEPLVNGSVGYINNIKKSYAVIPNYIKNLDNYFIESFNANFRPEVGSIYPEFKFDKRFLIEEVSDITPQIEYQIRRNTFLEIPDIPLRMTYGYAITCHSAQGSQWDKVLVLEEKFPYDKEEHARWLYTACTRPAQKLVLVR